MEWIGQFAGENGIPVLLFLLIALITSFILVKKGYLQLNKAGFQLGIQERERITIQRQTTFVHGQLDAIANILVKEHPDLDTYKTYWICKCIELEWVRSIHYNHVEDTEGYKVDRFLAIKAIVQKKTQHKYFFSQAFDSFLKNHVETVVKHLVEIRKSNSN